MGASANGPYLTTRGNCVEVRKTPDGPVAGRVESGPNMRPWGWTVGLGWHTGLPTVGAALDALLADPAFGVDVHGEGRPSASGRSEQSLCEKYGVPHELDGTGWCGVCETRPPANGSKDVR